MTVTKKTTPAPKPSATAKLAAALKAATPQLRHLLAGLVSALVVVGPLLESGALSAQDWISVALAFISGAGGAAYVSSVRADTSGD